MPSSVDDGNVDKLAGYELEEAVSLDEVAVNDEAPAGAECRGDVYNAIQLIEGHSAKTLESID